MGRIVFNADLFRPSMHRADRKEPESRSNVADMWMTPQGVLTAATLAKMAGGLKLPAGWRDKGVDANAEALKAAAQARQAAKKKIETTESKARSERMRITGREGDTEADKMRIRQNRRDEEAGRMAAKVKPQTLADMRDETMVRARAKAVELEKQGKMQEAMDVLEQAGDRIGQTSLKLGPEEREGRRRGLRQQQMRRHKRLAAGDQRYQGARGERGDALRVRDATALSPEAAEEAFNEALVLAKEGGQVKQAEAEVTEARDPYEAVGLKINLDDLRGEGSDRVKKMSREQLRDTLIAFKEGGREALMAEFSNQQLDQQEVAAFEEMLIGQMNRRRSQEAGVRGVDRLMTTEQEQKLTDETIDTFHAEKRREDPYYGMRPEDAVLQIMQDAPMAKTESEQRKLRSLMAKYTPKYQTFSDLFFDNTKERTMGNMANLEKLLPDAEKELTALQQAQQSLSLMKVLGETDMIKKLPPHMQEAALKLQVLHSRIDKNRAQANKARGHVRSGNQKGFIGALDVYRKNFDKNTNAHFKIDALKAEAAALLRKSKDESVAQALERAPAGSFSEVVKRLRGTASLSPEGREALSKLTSALERRDAYRVKASQALTDAQAKAKVGRLDEADKSLVRYLRMEADLNITEIGTFGEALGAIVDLIKGQR